MGRPFTKRNHEKTKMIQLIKTCGEFLVAINVYLVVHGVQPLTGYHKVRNFQGLENFCGFYETISYSYKLFSEFLHMIKFYAMNRSKLSSFENSLKITTS